MTNLLNRAHQALTNTSRRSGDHAAHRFGLTSRTAQSQEAVLIYAQIRTMGR